MAKYRGIVRTIYEHEVDIDAEDYSEAIENLKNLYNDNEKSEGLFVADAYSFLKAEFSLKK